jgi:hypothetical protein
VTELVTAIFLQQGVFRLANCSPQTNYYYGYVLNELSQLFAIIYKVVSELNLHEGEIPASDRHLEMKCLIYTCQRRKTRNMISSSFFSGLIKV